jgi:APA family basic amino acid/polyamine antiporter
VAAQITALGEIVTLPIVILVTIMAQPRLQYAMAVDGLLPSIFERMDADGNLIAGTCVAGGIMTVIATLVPFDKLNDMISCAVLCVLSLTDTSVVMLWHEPATDPDSPLTCNLMMIFHAATFAASLLITHFSNTAWGKFFTSVCVIAMISSCWAITKYCPRCPVFGGRREHYHESDLVRESGYFQTPFVPALPCLAIAINWYLIAQLDLLGIVMLIGFLALAVIIYLIAQYASGGNAHRFEEIEMPSDGNRKSQESSPSSGLLI